MAIDIAPDIGEEVIQKLKELNTNIENIERKLIE